MAIPAKFNLLIYQGDTFSRDFQINVNASGVYSPISLIDTSVLAQVRVKPEDESPLMSFQVTYLDVDNALIRLTLSSSQTRNLPYKSYYDIQTKTVSGVVKTWVYGRIESPREISRDYE